MRRRDFLGSGVKVLGAGALIGMIGAGVGCDGDTGEGGEGSPDTGGAPDAGGPDAPATPDASPDAAPPDAGPEPDAPTQDCESDGTDAEIGDNHGHELFVPAADIAAGAEATYDIEGTSAHPHTVTLSADDFASLQAGGTVIVTSTTDAAHAHEVTVSCA